VSTDPEIARAKDQNDAISALATKLEIAKQEDDADEDDVTADVDTDEDGFTDYDEKLVGTNPDDSEDFPTQDEVDEALLEQAAKFAE
jgi:hypothetical protein